MLFRFDNYSPVKANASEIWEKGQDWEISELPELRIGEVADRERWELIEGNWRGKEAEILVGVDGAPTRRRISAALAAVGEKDDEFEEHKSAVLCVIGWLY